MKTIVRYPFSILIFAFLVCLVTPALAQLTQEEAKQMYQWEQGKVPYDAGTIQTDIGKACKPIDPVDTVNPNFCYILQLQCWLDPSGYGPFRVKNCKNQDTIVYDQASNGYYITSNYKWFCDESDAKHQAAITQLSQIWNYRISQDPACVKKNP
jgi:hypothetical protein